MRTLIVLVSIFCLWSCNNQKNDKLISSSRSLTDDFEAIIKGSNTELDGLELSYAVLTQNSDSQSFRTKRIIHVPSKRLSYSVHRFISGSVVVLKHYINDSTFHRLDSIFVENNCFKNVVYYFSDSVMNENQMEIIMTVDSLKKMKHITKYFGAFDSQRIYDSLDANFIPVVSYFEGNVNRTYVNSYDGGHLVSRKSLDKIGEVIREEEFQYSVSGELKRKNIYISGLVSVVVYGEKGKGTKVDLIYGKFPTIDESPIYHPWFNVY